MATTQAPFLADRRDPPPPPPAALSSNNPFRKAALASPDTPPRSPQPPAAGLSVDDTMQRLNHRKSTNPFLDDYQAPAVTSPPQRPRSRSPNKTAPAAGGSADVFAGLSLLDKPLSGVSAGGPSTLKPSQPRPQPSKDTIRSQAEHDRRRILAGKERGPPPSRQFDVFGKPAAPSRSDRPRPRPRRNSESSVMDAQDEDRKRTDKERQRRARGDAGKDGKPRDPRTGKPSRRLDLIDKLDLTGIYGPGAFHHDGPFDACNPHRNRKGRKHTPMSAFPEGSANNTMGGSGPVSQAIDYDRFHGRAQDAYHDWNKASQNAENALMSRKAPPGPNLAVESFDPRMKVEQVHGEESAGLGTSTFLEGTTVPTRVLQQRRESQLDDSLTAGPGLQRKKSLAQKIRGISKSRPAGLAERSLHSPTNEGRVASPSSPLQVQSAGGRVTNENKPFFSDFAGQMSDRPGTASKEGPKETTIKISEPTIKPVDTRARAGSESAHQAARRSSLGNGPAKSRSSNESFDEYGLPSASRHQQTPSGGFLNRVRSLKSKKRPDRTAAA